MIRELFENRQVLIICLSIVLLFFMQPPPFLNVSCSVCSVYSSEEDEEETEMYEHDYDGTLAKAGKRHLGKTRWTREEVHTHACSCLNNSKPSVQYEISHSALKRDHFSGDIFVLFSGLITFILMLILEAVTYIKYRGYTNIYVNVLSFFRMRN